MDTLKLPPEVFLMPRTRVVYTTEFYSQVVDPVRARCDLNELAREFEPTAQSIRTWVVQAERSEGRRKEAEPGLAGAERDELVQLRCENRQRRVERDILLKAATSPIAHVRWGSGLVRTRDWHDPARLVGFTSADVEPSSFFGCRHNPCA